MGCLTQLKYLLPFGWTCWVHFLMVELRAVYLFYISVKSFTTKIAVSAEMQRQIGGSSGSHDWTDDKSCIKDEALNARIQCIKSGVQEALWKVYINEGDLSGCYREGVPGFSYVGALHLSALVVCGFFFFIGFCQLLGSNASDWRSGEYLHFTWKLEHTPAYKMVASLLVGYAFSSMVFVMLCSLNIVPNKHMILDAQNLMLLGLADMIGLIGAACAMLSVHDPPFKWEDPQLLRQTFVRPWAGLLHQSNDQYGHTLDHAILQARLGNLQELETLVGHHVQSPFGMNDERDPNFATVVALRAVDPPRPRELEDLDLSPRKGGGCCWGSSRTGEFSLAA
mmetsp:Transcript_23243/g.59346  ORF Transcript_23243/g.59346 Transcript_23243/m.59346 type:complete len:338 (-) Transcript_23243:112-1125(-)